MHHYSTAAKKALITDVLHLLDPYSISALTIKDTQLIKSAILATVDVIERWESIDEKAKAELDAEEKATANKALDSRVGW